MLWGWGARSPAGGQQSRAASGTGPPVLPVLAPRVPRAGGAGRRSGRGAPGGQNLCQKQQGRKPSSRYLADIAPFLGVGSRGATPTWDGHPQRQAPRTPERQPQDSQRATVGHAFVATTVSRPSHQAQHTLGVLAVTQDRWLPQPPGHTVSVGGLGTWAFAWACTGHPLPGQSLQSPPDHSNPVGVE